LWRFINPKIANFFMKRLTIYGCPPQKEVYIAPMVESETIKIENGFAASSDYGTTGAAGRDAEQSGSYDDII
jgi:hypothetical protein